MLLTALPCDGRAENWPRFRGENGVGTSELQGVPVTWSPGDYDWNIELPGVGHSSPVIWEDTLFITSAIDEGAVRYLFCLDADTGQERWSRSVGGNRSAKHAKSSWASSTPATDGERVYVAFADKESYTLAAYDFDGGLVWRQNLGPYESQHGLGVSPIVYEDLVILPNDQRGPSSVMAFDAKTGRIVWSTLRTFREASYATPIVIDLPGRDPQLICASGATGLTSLDPRTGLLNWQTDPFPLRTVASPVHEGGVVVMSCGQGGKGTLLVAVEPDGSGDVEQTHVKYRREKLLPYVPTPIGYEGHLYLWGDNGVVTCTEAATGKDVWVERVGGNYSGSPVCIDGKIYAIDEGGRVVVIKASPEFELLGETELGDPSHATPAVANGRLYLRTYHRLMALRAEPAK
jgi:outer membrane protein assembly factor BamB